MVKAKKIKEIMIQSGFSLCGICSFSSLPQLRDTRNKELLPVTAKSVIVGALPYYTEDAKEQNISKYAVIPDYHKIIAEYCENAVAELKKLYKNNEFVPFSDNSPIDEREAARLSGIGKMGLHNLIITEKYGSFILLAEIVTDLTIEPDKPLGYCEGCFACVKACPSSALKGKEGLKRENCISSITQKKGELTETEQDLFKKGYYIWGCDICQNACPHNKNLSPVSTFDDGILRKIKLSDIEDLSINEFIEKYKDRAFVWRGKDTLIRNIKLKS